MKYDVDEFESKCAVSYNCNSTLMCQATRFMLLVLRSIWMMWIYCIFMQIHFNFYVNWYPLTGTLRDKEMLPKQFYPENHFVWQIWWTLPARICSAPLQTPEFRDHLTIDWLSPIPESPKKRTLASSEINEFVSMTNVSADVDWYVMDAFNRLDFRVFQSVVANIQL